MDRMRNDDPMWNVFVARRLAEFPIFARREVAGKAVVTRFQRQPGIELHITHRGRGTFCLNEDIHPQVGRDIVFLSGDCAHQVFADPTSGYERTVICFDHHLRSPAGALGFEEFNIRLPQKREGRRLVLTVDKWDVVEECSNRLVEEFTQRNMGWETMMFGTLLQLLVVIQRHGQDAATHQTCESLVGRCMALIDANLDQDLSLSFLAQKLYISPKHLSRTFSNQVGMTISTYILRQRLKLAKRLLKENDVLSIQGVAFKCGFKSASHFSSSFTRYVGVTPSAYRSLYQ